MGDYGGQSRVQSGLVTGLNLYACLGCAIFAVSNLIADFVVPGRDWIADRINDLGAGRFEFIVDIGFYAFSAALVAMALGPAHLHLGDWDWSLGVIGLALAGLIVFVVGARKEYGDNDNDNEGVVIHVYLDYALGLIFAAVPLGLARRAASAGAGRTCAALAECGAGVLSAADRDRRGS